MQYLGSKNRIAKHIKPLILERLKADQYYVEPFVGGCNLIDKIAHPLRIGADLNYHLIEMWKALQNGWTPPETVTEDDYKYLKFSQDLEDPALVAFVGFLVSFAGKWFAGYAQNKKGDNYADRGCRALATQIKDLKDVDFRYCSYENLEIPPKSLIYCDPPYRGTTGYKMGFDNDKFWQWCRERAADGHTVLISEYSAPEDFICLIDINHTSGVNKSKRVERIERLYTFDPLMV